MRIINCHLCDKEIEVNSVNKYCLDCRKEKKKEWGKKTNANKKARSPNFIEKMWK